MRQISVCSGTRANQVVPSLDTSTSECDIASSGTALDQVNVSVLNIAVVLEIVREIHGGHAPRVELAFHAIPVGQR
ncbi:hypothetical protein [Gemmatimonas sp.]|uniref:hypothetical protein n=1 Tax=Gemmatimonas sp. TaxID=1962908 RepID=UPI0022C391EC|nr:hypothetical protein [Gemmatimonas sp.]MCZ8204314.1 hypothetical protein [Gemmatimonas sp.]